MLLVSPPQPFHARIVASLPPGAPHHSMFGVNAAPGAACPNCSAPLQVFFTLDTSDARLPLPASAGAQFPLLWCWSCPIASGPFTYSVTRGAVKLLRHEKGRPTSDFPYENYPRTFPASPLQLVPISPRAQRLIRELNSGHSSYPWRHRCASKPVHQIGGTPYLLQGPEYQSHEPRDLACPGCNKAMPLFATAGNRCTDSRGLCGNEYVQVLFHVCAADSIVTAIQQAD